MPQIDEAITGASVPLGAAANSDLFAAQGLSLIQEDSSLSLWLSASADLVTCSLVITPPGSAPIQLVRPTYNLNVETSEIDDEWDVVFRDLAIPGNSTLSLVVTTGVNPATVMMKAHRKRAMGPVPALPNVVLDGGSQSVLANSVNTDILVNSALRRRPNASLFSLLATASAVGLIGTLRITADTTVDLINGLPVNVRTQVIAVPKDRFNTNTAIGGNSILQGLMNNPTAGAITVRWHAASVGA